MFDVVLQIIDVVLWLKTQCLACQPRSHSCSLIVHGKRSLRLAQAGDLWKGGSLCDCCGLCAFCFPLADLLGVVIAAVRRRGRRESRLSSSSVSSTRWRLWELADHLFVVCSRAFRSLMFVFGQPVNKSSVASSKMT